MAKLTTAQNLTNRTELMANKQGLLKRANKDSGPVRTSVGTNRVGFVVMTTTAGPASNEQGLLKRANKCSGPVPSRAGTNRVHFAVEAASQTGGDSNSAATKLKRQTAFERAKTAHPRKGKIAKIETLAH